MYYIIIILYYSYIKLYYIIIVYCYIVLLYYIMKLYYIIILYNYRGLLELTCPTACTCLFKLRPGVLSKTLSYMLGKLNLPMFYLKWDYYSIFS